MSTLSLDEGWPLCVATSPNASDAVYVGFYTGAVIEWCSKSDEHKRFIAHEGSTSALAISTDGKRLYSGGSDNKVRGWDTESHAMIFSTSCNGKVDRVILDEDWLFAALNDQNIAVIEARTGIQKRSLMQINGFPWGIVLWHGWSIVHNCIYSH